MVKFHTSSSYCFTLSSICWSSDTYLSASPILSLDRKSFTCCRVAFNRAVKSFCCERSLSRAASLSFMMRSSLSRKKATNSSSRLFVFYDIFFVPTIENGEELCVRVFQFFFFLFSTQSQVPQIVI